MIIINSYRIAPSPSSLLTDLAAYYKLDESSGTAIDQLGLHNGTVNGATQNATGKLNTAYSFDGTNDYVNLGAVSTTGVLTYACWVFTGGTGSRGILCGKSGVSVNGAPYMRINSANKVEFLKNASASIGTSTGTVSLATWTHVAVTYNNSTGAYVFYINGSASGSGTSVQTFTFDNFSFGCQRASDEWFNGSIDELGIWNRVLTAGEISSLYNAGTGLSYPF